MDEREKRKKRFIERLKKSKFKALFEPLKTKIDRYLADEIDEEDVMKTVHYVSKQGNELTTTFKKRVDVILAGISMEENRYATEINGISVKLRQGDITLTFADAIINPASPSGEMNRGLSGVLKKAGGEEIEKEAVASAPISTDKPVATSPSTLPLKHIIHTVTIQDEQTSAEIILRATKSALQLAEELECEVVAIPGLGTGVGGISPEEASKAIINAIKEHNATNIKDIILIDMNEEVVNAFEKVLEQFDEGEQ